MRLSVQLYTVREPMKSDWEGTLRALAAIGLRHVELAGLHGRTPGEWRDLLGELDMMVSGSHVGVDRLISEFESVVEDSLALDNRYVIVPWVDISQYRGGWTEFGLILESLGRRLDAEGLILAYHNHAFEFDGGGYETLQNSCTPEAVKMQVDVAWVQHAGVDPATLIHSLGDRAPLVHLKDITNDPANLHIEAGRGIVDWPSVLAACDKVGVEYGAIELDECPHPPLESVRMSYEFLRPLVEV